MKYTGKYAHLLTDVEMKPSHGEGGTISDAFIDNLIANTGMRQASIRPFVLSHILVHDRQGDWKSGLDVQSFRIAVTGKPECENTNPINMDSLSIHTLAKVVATTGSGKEGALAEAIIIAADLRSYYLRHYSGRCLRNTSESNFDAYAHGVPYACVYIAFFDKANHPPKDGL